MRRRVVLSVFLSMVVAPHGYGQNPKRTTSNANPYQEYAARIANSADSAVRYFPTFEMAFLRAANAGGDTIAMAALVGAVSADAMIRRTQDFDARVFPAELERVHGQLMTALSAISGSLTDIARAGAAMTCKREFERREACNKPARMMAGIREISGKLEEGEAGIDAYRQARARAQSILEEHKVALSELILPARLPSTPSAAKRTELSSSNAVTQPRVATSETASNYETLVASLGLNADDIRTAGFDPAKSVIGKCENNGRGDIECVGLPVKQSAALCRANAAAAIIRMAEAVQRRYDQSVIFSLGCGDYRLRVEYAAGWAKVSQVDLVQGTLIFMKNIHYDP